MSKAGAAVDQGVDFALAWAWQPVVGGVADALRWVGEHTLPHEGEAAKKAAITGTWFLSPERHAVEIMLLPPLFAAIAYTMVRLNQRQFPAAPKSCKPYPAWVGVLWALMIAATYAYKSTRGMHMMLYALMPCHIFNQVALAALIVPSTRWRRRLLSLMLTWQTLPLYATFLPDTRGLTMPLEVPFYWVQHIAAISFPVHAMVSGRVRAVDNLRYWFLGWGLGVCFYFIVGTLLALRAGVNLNFMLSPPMGFEAAGQDFRLVVAVGTLIMLGCGRVLAVAYQALLDRSGLLPADAAVGWGGEGGAGEGKAKGKAHRE